MVARQRMLLSYAYTDRQYMPHSLVQKPLHLLVSSRLDDIIVQIVLGVQISSYDYLMW